MDPIKTGRFHADYNVFELMVFSQDISDHVFKKLCTLLCVRNGLHFYEELLVEIKSRNDMGTGCNVNPNKKR